MPQYCPSVCPSVTFRYRDHICWNTSKIISPPNSDKLVMWRFLRNRRLLLCLHTIFRALIYWAHHAVILAIAWHLVFIIVCLSVTWLWRLIWAVLTGVLATSDCLWFRFSLGFSVCFCVCFWCISSCLFCVVSTSASDCLERLISEVTYYMSSGT